MLCSIIICCSSLQHSWRTTRSSWTSRELTLFSFTQLFFILFFLKTQVTYNQIFVDLPRTNPGMLLFQIEQVLHSIVYVVLFQIEQAFCSIVYIYIYYAYMHVCVVYVYTHSCCSSKPSRYCIVLYICMYIYTYIYI